MKNPITAQRLSTALANANMIPQELANASGVSKASISQYLNGSHSPSNISSGKMAKILNVNPVWLMGFDVPMIEQVSFSPAISNIFPIELKKFPVLGEIACGIPKYANEERESYIMAGTDIKADFCLKASGDSMIGVRIKDGDIVFIRKQDIVENGEIAAVIVNDENEATLKRFFYYQEKALLILKAENPKYEDLIFTKDELDKVHVLGKAIAFQSDIE
ncbi:MAG: S24 family peptidase [Blautia sp.]|nr:S24 family peptidase [Blautia sp.]